MLRASVDLPTPLGPTRMALVASLRKSSAISASKAERSQRLGQVQSKSQSGLKRPVWAPRRRRSGLRRVRSCSSQSISVASQPAAAASPQCASRPCRLSALARLCRASRLLIALLLELVIGFEPVRLHVGIARLDMVGQNDGDGRCLVAQLAAVIECEPHRIGMRHAARDRLAALLRLLERYGAAEL